MGLSHRPPHAAPRREGPAGRLGEGRQADHARGGHAARVPETPEAVELLRRRDRRGPREPRGAGLPRRHAGHAVGHGRHPVHHGRVQVPAVPGGRLLRRDGGLLDAVALPERRHGGPDAP